MGHTTVTRKLSVSLYTFSCTSVSFKRAHLDPSSKIRNVDIFLDPSITVNPI
jgi:hypothetical protein